MDVQEFFDPERETLQKLYFIAEDERGRNAQEELYEVTNENVSQIKNLNAKKIPYKALRLLEGYWAERNDNEDVDETYTTNNSNGDQHSHQNKRIMNAFFIAADERQGSKNAYFYEVNRKDLANITPTLKYFEAKIVPSKEIAEILKELTSNLKVDKQEGEASNETVSDPSIMYPGSRGTHDRQENFDAENGDLNYQNVYNNASVPCAPNTSNQINNHESNNIDENVISEWGAPQENKKEDMTPFPDKEIGQINNQDMSAGLTFTNIERAAEHSQMETVQETTILEDIKPTIVAINQEIQENPEIPSIQENVKTELNEIIVQDVLFTAKNTASEEEEMYIVNAQDIPNISADILKLEANKVPVNDLEQAITELIAETSVDLDHLNKIGSGKINEHRSRDITNVYFIARHNSTGEEEINELDSQDISRIEQRLKSTSAEIVPYKTLLLLIQKIKERPTENSKGQIVNIDGLDIREKDGILYCPYCEEQGSIQEKWKMPEHIRKVHLNLKLSCPSCDHKTSSKHKMKLHMENEHGIAAEGNNATKKDVNDNQYDYKSKIVQGNEKDKIEDKGIPSGEKERMENLKYQDLEARPFSCSSCEMRFARRDRLEAHVKALHEKIKDNLCPHCEYVTSWPKALKKHLEKMHPNPDINNGYKDQNFMKREELGSYSGATKKETDTSLHSNSSPIFKDLQKCPECPYKTPSIDDINQHVSVFHQNHQKFKNLAPPMGKPNATTRFNIQPPMMKRDPGLNANAPKSMVQPPNDYSRRFDNSMNSRLSSDLNADNGANLRNFGGRDNQFDRNNSNTNFGSSQSKNLIHNQIDNFMNSQNSNYNNFQKPNQGRNQNANIGNHPNSNFRDYDSQTNFRSNMIANFRKPDNFSNYGNTNDSNLRMNQNYNSRAHDNFSNARNDANFNNVRNDASHASFGNRMMNSARNQQQWQFNPQPGPDFDRQMGSNQRQQIASSRNYSIPGQRF